MKFKKLALAISLVGFSSMTLTANAGSLCTASSPCTALVIGNSAYQKVDPLKNAVNDAMVMQATLKSLGFEVILKEDVATQADMLLALDEFYNQLKGKKGIGLFFYAGHGIQVKGENYLIPTQGEVISGSDVDYKLLPLKQVLDKMQDAENAVNIIVVDACRNSPSRGISRSVISDGLASVKPPVDSMVIFSTSLSQLASDGVGGNSPFTINFSKYMKKPGLKIEDVLKKVREALLKETGHQQLSGEYTTLTKDFCFVSCPTASSINVEAITAENEDFKVKIAELTKELDLLKGKAKKTMKQQIEELQGKIVLNDDKIKQLSEFTREVNYPQPELTLKQQLEEMKQRIK